MSSSLQETRNSAMHAKVNVSALGEKQNITIKCIKMAPLTSLIKSCLLQLGANGIRNLLQLSFRVNVAIAILLT